MNKTNIRYFYLIWFGQLVSQIGSGLTGFAMAVWVYQTTGSVTQFSLITLATTLPGVLLSPIAGVLVDRWDRRWVLLLSDTGAALCTLTIAVLLYNDALSLWSIVLLLSISSSCRSLQMPAYSASVPLLVPKDKLGNYNGIRQLAVALPRVAAPALAGLLVETIEMWGVVFIDFVTFLIAVVTLLMVRIPRPESATAKEKEKSSILQEALEAWRFLRSQSALMAIVGFFSTTYFTIGLVNVCGPALILSFTSAASLGGALSLSGVGFVAGSLCMAVWGGPKLRIHGVLGFTVLFSLGVLLGGIYPSIVLILIAMVLITFSAPLIFGCSEALWQAKVPVEMQGRVFALKNMVTRLAMPIAYVVAGPLADQVFEPLMRVGGPLAGTVGQVIGTGPGRGIGLMLILFGTLPILAAALAWLNPKIRNFERDIPDAIPEPAGAVAAS
ncbi:MAG: MFS transporter [Acidobacteriota bacterium]